MPSSLTTIIYTAVHHKTDFNQLFSHTLKVRQYLHYTILPRRIRGNQVPVALLRSRMGYLSTGALQNYVRTILCTLLLDCIR